MLTGRVAQGFPVPITEVKVLQGTRVVATAPVAADGSFRLSVAPAKGLAIRLAGTSHSGLVMPRQSGQLAYTFSIRAGGAPWDLGQIHFVGSSTATVFTYHSAGSMHDECDDDDHDSTGATCVSDDREDEDTCEADDHEGESDDSLTSASSSDDDGVDDGDSVPEHDFPEDGCSGTGNGSGSGSGSGV